MTACVVCGARLVQKRRGGPRKFCSHACSNRDWRRRKKAGEASTVGAVVECSWCFQPFVQTGGNQLRCSRRCSRDADNWAAWNPSDRCDIEWGECRRCGGPFIARANRRKWCSRRCCEMSKERGPFKNVTKWRKLREQIMDRDGWKCQIRGPECTTEATDVDHIIPWRAGGSWYDPQNLRASCRPCNSGRVFRGQTATPSREWT